MMTQKDIERKRLQVAIAGMTASKMEVELKVMEKEQEIQRLKDHLALQAKSIAQAETALQKIGE